MTKYSPSRSAKSAVALLSALFAVVVLAAPAGAQATYPTPTVTAGGPTQSAGGSYSVPLTVSGCKPASTVTFTSGSTSLGSATTDSSGGATSTVTLPAGSTGAVTVSATCVDSAGVSKTFSTTVTIPGGGTSGGGTSGGGASSGAALAVTGSDTSSVLVRVGAIIAVLGVALVVASRSRRSEHTTV